VGEVPGKRERFRESERGSGAYGEVQGQWEILPGCRRG